MRLALLALAVLAAPPAAWFAARLTDGNFGIVEPNQVFRSGQLSAKSLSQRVQQHHIKTVLNLRGPSPRAPWHADERAATLDAGASHIDIALSSCEWMSRDQARALLEVLETAPRPLLLHCQWGSERTGLVSAFLVLLRPGGTLEQAESQFRLHYLYLPIGDGVVTAHHLQQYRDYLTTRNLPHTPNHFRHWLNEDFHPGTPSRESWPWDPFPLVVTTTRPPA